MYQPMDIKLLAQAYNLTDIDQQLGDQYWSPIDVAKMNGWVLRAAAFKGEYHWHTHDYDELFFVYKGQIVIDTEKGSLVLSEGQGAVMPKGLNHKPKAEMRAVVLMLDLIE